MPVIFTSDSSSSQATKTFASPSLASLPDATAIEHDFTDTSFFTVPGQTLPDPALIDLSLSRRITKFPCQRLLIKHGPEASVAEAITGHVIRKVFASLVKVPEVFGWRVRDGHVLIYMELVEGDTLQDRWKSLTQDDRKSVCKQLADMIATLRKLVPSPEDSQSIGTIVNGPVIDRIFEGQPAAGPFSRLTDLYTWMEWLPQRFLVPSKRYIDPYVPHLPTDSSIVFTHADIHPSNIMLCKSGPPRVVALLDWGQSGWLPDWWEYYKMCYTTDYEGEWRRDFIPLIISLRENELEIMAHYASQIGAL